MSSEDYQKGCAPCSQLLVKQQLEEEDEDLGKKGADAPHYELYKPGLKVDELVGVKFVIMVDRHVFIGVDATFQDLKG